MSRISSLIVFGIMIGCVSSVSARLKPRVYADVSQLMHAPPARVEKVVGEPYSYGSDKIDHVGVFRYYHAKFGDVIVEYHVGKMESLDATLKRPEPSAVAVAARFGINVSRRNPTETSGINTVWTGSFPGSSVRRVSVAKGDGVSWNSIEITDNADQ